jgi:acetoin utilization protein AcuC
VTAPAAGAAGCKADVSRAVFIGRNNRRRAYGRLHPLSIPRVEAVLDLCQALDWFAPGELLGADPATPAELCRFHAPEYVEALRAASERGAALPADREHHGLGGMENPVFPEVYQRATETAGGSLAAARHVLAIPGGVAFHPAGGMHHGLPGRAHGFCYFNDVVLALDALLQAGLERVLYVDLDAHHGDGVQFAYGEDPRVGIICLHEQDRWPHSGMLTDPGRRLLNLAVPAGFHDLELQQIMDSLVLPLARGFSPQAVVLTCGSDALAGDPLARMALGNASLWTAIQSLLACAPRAVVLGGGGYNPWLLARYWSGLWGLLSGRALPDTLPQAARAVLEGLDSDLVDPEDRAPHWLDRLQDPVGRVPVRPWLAEMLQAAHQRLRSDPWHAPVAATHDGALAHELA